MKLIAIESHGVKPAIQITLPKGTVVYTNLPKLEAALLKTRTMEELDNFHVFYCNDTDVSFICGKHYTKGETVFTRCTNDDLDNINIQLNKENVGNVYHDFSRGKQRNDKQTHKTTFRTFSELSLSHTDGEL